MQTWVYRQERETGPAWFEPTARQALEFFSEHIGPYSYEKLANVEAAVIPAPMRGALLGNSFLMRFQMKRENDVMRLEKRN